MRRISHSACSFRVHHERSVWNCVVNVVLNCPCQRMFDHTLSSSDSPSHTVNICRGKAFPSFRGVHWSRMVRFDVVRTCRYQRKKACAFLESVVCFFREEDFVSSLPRPFVGAGSLQDSCSFLLHFKVLFPATFLNSKYTKGVLFLSKVVCKRVMGACPYKT